MDNAPTHYMTYTGRWNGIDVDSQWRALMYKYRNMVSTKRTRGRGHEDCASLEESKARRLVLASADFTATVTNVKT
jgi:hypothetical protein